MSWYGLARARPFRCEAKIFNVDCGVEVLRQPRSQLDLTLDNSYFSERDNLMISGFFQTGRVDAISMAQLRLRKYRGDMSCVWCLNSSTTPSVVVGVASFLALCFRWQYHGTVFKRTHMYLLNIYLSTQSMTYNVLASLHFSTRQ